MQEGTEVKIYCKVYIAKFKIFFLTEQVNVDFNLKQKSLQTVLSFVLIPLLSIVASRQYTFCVWLIYYQANFFYRTLNLNVFHMYGFAMHRSHILLLTNPPTYMRNLIHNNFFIRVPQQPLLLQESQRQFSLCVQNLGRRYCHFVVSTRLIHCGRSCFDRCLLLVTKLDAVIFRASKYWQIVLSFYHKACVLQTDIISVTRPRCT